MRDMVIRCAATRLSNMQCDLWTDHHALGPVVRVGPKAAYVSDVPTVRAIYGARSGFLKDPSFYVGGSVRSVFSALDPSFHAQRRRVLGPCFAESSLEELQPTVFDRARLCISKMDEEIKKNGCTDILHWWTLFAMDVISELSFGESFHMLEDGKVSDVFVMARETTTDAFVSVEEPVCRRHC